MKKNIILKDICHSKKRKEEKTMGIPDREYATKIY